MKFIFTFVSIIALPAVASFTWADTPSNGGLATAMQPFVDHGTLAGAVMLVASKDKVLDVETVGYEDVDANKPMTPYTEFWIASMTKAMTCSALMMLVDEGKVNLDDPVEKYLPEFKDEMVIAEKDDQHVLLKKPARKITVRMLMSHTAGLPTRTGADDPTYDMTPLAQRIADYATAPLVSEPGTKFLYTNVGMTTVGRIIEVVGGMPYEQFLQQRLFTPLGMTDTTFHPNGEQLRRLAKCYRTNAAQTGLEVTGLDLLNRDLSDPQRVAWPGGGLFSTAADVARFCQMCLNGGVANGQRLLSEASITAMTSKETGDTVPDDYGFGWFVVAGGYSHNGAAKTEMRVYPSKNLITVFLVQQVGDWPNADGKDIMPTFAKAAEKLAPVAAAASTP